MSTPDIGDHDPLDLVGRSVHDDLVLAYLRANDASTPHSVFEGSSACYGSFDGGFCASAQAVDHYRREVGEPRSRVTNAPSEMIVKRIDFMDAGCSKKGSAPYLGPLPFGLRFGATAAEVTRALGVRLRRKGRSSTLPGFSPEAFVWNYTVGETSVVIKLTEAVTLCAIYISAIDRTEREARERKASLQAESRNIDPTRVETIEALRASIPTSRWRESLADGDTLFTEANIAAADLVLNDYIDKVKLATAKRSAPAIYAATKSAMLRLNKLNRRHGLIETLERDELGVFVDRVIGATGFRLNEGEDITLLWRDW